MTEQELQKVLSKGESQTLELKATVPAPEQIARNLASMANSEGGILVLGVKAPERAVGVNVRRAKVMLRAAQRYIDPPLAVNVEDIILDGHPVVVATVSRTSHLVSASGGYYRRVGRRSRPLTAGEIRERAAAEQNDQEALTELSSALAAQTQTLDQLQKDFRKANSPWRKIGVAIAGAIAGAIAKHFFDIYF